MTGDKKGFAAQMVLHMKLHKCGSVFQRELTDFKGIFVTDRRETRQDPVTREILYNGELYENINSAVEAWKADNADSPTKGI